MPRLSLGGKPERAEVDWELVRAGLQNPHVALVEQQVQRLRSLCRWLLVGVIVLASLMAWLLVDIYILSDDHPSTAQSESTVEMSMVATAPPAVAALPSPAPTWTPSPTPPAQLVFTGRVYQHGTDQPVSDADVTLGEGSDCRETGLTASTGADGTFDLRYQLPTSGDAEYCLYLDYRDDGWQTSAFELLSRFSYHRFLT